jgi:hypothetical protein
VRERERERERDRERERERERERKMGVQWGAASEREEAVRGRETWSSD